MSVIALYVYDTMIFTTDTTIEPMVGAPILAGEVTLQPGIYRLAGDAKISATAMPRGNPSYSLVELETKGGSSDPPLSPMPGYEMSEIMAFFGGAGTANAI